MPRSAISMNDHDGEYTFDIDGYLIRAYPTMTKPVRRAICSEVRSAIDEELVEEMIDDIILQYALDLQQWKPPEDDEE